MWIVDLFIDGEQVPGLLSDIEIVDGNVNVNVSVLRDTGSETVVIHRKYFEPANFTGEVRIISLADGTVSRAVLAAL